jgi:hypothetical protein
VEKTIKILHIIYNTCHILEIKKYTCKHLILIQINLCSCDDQINPLNSELHPISHLLALLGAHHILHVSRIRVKKDRIVKDIKLE